MENLIAVTHRVLQDSDLANWVQSKGGYWINDGLRQGVIERGRGAVYLSIYDTYLSEIEPVLLCDIETQLGRPPATAVSFTISRSPGSEGLADELLNVFCIEWTAIQVGD